MAGSRPHSVSSGEAWPVSVPLIPRLRPRTSRSRTSGRPTRTRRGRSNTTKSLSFPSPASVTTSDTNTSPSRRSGGLGGMVAHRNCWKTRGSTGSIQRLGPPVLPIRPTGPNIQSACCQAPTAEAKAPTSEGPALRQRARRSSRRGEGVTPLRLVHSLARYLAFSPYCPATSGTVLRPERSASRSASVAAKYSCSGRTPASPMRILPWTLTFPTSEPTPSFRTSTNRP